MKISRIFAYAFAIAFLFACSEGSFDDMDKLYPHDNGLKNSEKEGVPDSYCNNEPVIFDLIAGRTMHAGMVTLTNDEVNLYITYETTDGSLIEEVHVYVGDSAGIPVNKQNIPVPGQFPYSTENIHLSSFTVIIPLSEITVECPLILTHAALSNGETAWGWENEEEMFTFENFFDIKRWGYLGDYCIEECTDEKLLTFKSWFSLPDGDSSWAVIEAVEQYYFMDKWCDVMGVIVPEEHQVLNLTNNTNNTILGEVAIDIEGDHIHIRLDLDNPDFIPFHTYVFYGTEAELIAYGFCPYYPDFPYIFLNEEADEFDIPLN